MKCKSCKKRMVRVIYTGLPVWLCSDDECNTVDGFWSFIMDYIPFNGMFMTYKGSYWKALWHWIIS